MTEVVNRRRQRLHEELKRITEALIRDYKPQKIILFGSMGSGNISEYSDIDICIIKQTNQPFLDRLVTVANIADPHVGVEFFVYTPEEVKAFEERGHYFWRDEIVGKGRVIYEQQG
jgi:predicted nucleotidyltransferase